MQAIEQKKLTGQMIPSVAYKNNEDEINSEVQGNEINLDVRMTKTRGTSLVAKILEVDSQHTGKKKGVFSEDSIILAVSIQTDMFVVSFIRLFDLLPLARFEF